jgi:hypothetical protein
MHGFKPLTSRYTLLPLNASAEHRFLYDTRARWLRACTSVKRPALTLEECQPCVDSIGVHADLLTIVSPQLRKQSPRLRSRPVLVVNLLPYISSETTLQNEPVALVRS